MASLKRLPPTGKYGCILADPPWRFRTWNETNQHKSASRHYSLMEDEDIKALPVKDAAADNCVLLLWAINPMLPHALETMAAWGFKFKTVALTWAKRMSTDKAWHFGLGYWTRQNTEQLLLGVRGKPRAVGRDVPQLMVAPRREHSRKPDETYDRAERLIVGPYLELFARQSRKGWDSWGLETGKFNVAD